MSNASKSFEKDLFCADCGMRTETLREYHPHVACRAFKVELNSDTVRANLRAVVEYGMMAGRAGVSLDDAMADFNTVLIDSNAKPKPDERKTESQDGKKKCGKEFRTSGGTKSFCGRNVNHDGKHSWYHDCWACDGQAGTHTDACRIYGRFNNV